MKIDRATSRASTASQDESVDHLVTRTPITGTCSLQVYIIERILKYIQIDMEHVHKMQGKRDSRVNDGEHDAKCKIKRYENIGMPLRSCSCTLRRPTECGATVPKGPDIPERIDAAWARRREDS